MKKIIIDTDPGIDDAVAIAIALFNPAIQVELLTTVAGNVGLEHVTQNALKLLHFFGKEVPVAKGAGKPLIEKFEDASHIHGASGLEGFDFPQPTNSHLLLEKHAVEAMKDCILSSPEKITLVPIGPLTNIALLFSLYPEVKENIEEIILMGGSITRGNKGVMSEFNIATDPEAGFVVFHSGLPLTMVGLDIGLQALVGRKHSEEIKTMNPIGAMFYALF
ncbi:MAG: nucleoside hydrolase, partial [Spirochaetota bacterium]